MDGTEAIANSDNTDSYCGLKPFKSGSEWTGNAKGRPKGSRNKVSTAFYQDVYQLWLDHGNQALADMLAESPTKFCQMVANVLPKHIDIDTNDSARWVINAQPQTVLEWSESHGITCDNDTDIPLSAPTVAVSGIEQPNPTPSIDRE